MESWNLTIYNSDHVSTVPKLPGTSKLVARASMSNSQASASCPLPATCLDIIEDGHQQITGDGTGESKACANNVNIKATFHAEVPPMNLNNNKSTVETPQLPFAQTQSAILSAHMRRSGSNVTFLSDTAQALISKPNSPRSGPSHGCINLPTEPCEGPTYTNILQEHEVRQQQRRRFSETDSQSYVTALSSLPPARFPGSNARAVAYAGRRSVDSYFNAESPVMPHISYDTEVATGNDLREAYANRRSADAYFAAQGHGSFTPPSTNNRFNDRVDASRAQRRWGIAVQNHPNTQHLEYTDSSSYVIGSSSLSGTEEVLAGVTECLQGEVEKKPKSLQSWVRKMRNSIGNSQRPRL